MINKKKCSFVAIISFLLIFILCDKKRSFVTVDGNDFVKEGKPYHYLGTNMWYGALLGMKENPGDRQRLKRELDHLKSLGIKNLRIMGASEGTKFDNTVQTNFQPKLGQYNEQMLVGLDYLLSEMEKRNMKAVIYLGNYWIWSGGFSQYINWVTGQKIPNPFYKEHTGQEFMKFSSKFYSNEKAKKAYRDYIKMLINRENTITKEKYKNDPTIMAWQLANEPRPPKNKKKHKYFIKWVENTAKFIKSQDHHHLVSTGNEGTIGCLKSEELYENIHNSKYIDYMTAHLWVFNWQWYDPQKPYETFPTAKKKSTNYLQKQISIAKKLNKPLVIEEFGIPRDNHLYSPQSSTNFRDKYFEILFNMIYENAIKGGPLAGSNFWSWAGEGRPVDPNDAEWEKGDPFTGDPPQEPQGRNSVFNSDTSTIKLLQKYANKMENIKN